MPEPVDSRVAVYIDFDNIVISRYAQVHPAHRNEKLSTFTDDVAMDRRLDAAKVDIGAILDYASSFGSIVISRAYADWSLPVNSRYQSDLISRAVDLTQLFPTAGTKNGADIRLAVDLVEDTLRLPAITHVVIVAGDSDYIPLAQRAKRLNTYVVGIGVAGSTSHSLAEACNEFKDYDELPGVMPLKKTALKTEDTQGGKTPTKNARSEPEDRLLQSSRDKAAAVLERALRLGHEKDDEDWLNASGVKEQMKRIDPKFSEKALGFSTFMDFVRSRPKIAQVKNEGQVRMLRLSSRSLNSSGETTKHD